MWERPNAGKLDREYPKEKQQALKASIRKIKNASIDPDPRGVLTNEIRRDFGLPPVDSSRTEVSEPTGVVRHPPRPEGYNGGVAFFTEGEELIRSRLLIRPKETLTCNETELGAAISMALCRENAKGQQVADTKPGNRLNPQAGPGGGTIPGTSRLRGIVSLCLK